jgi:hypothetical protein
MTIPFGKIFNRIPKQIIAVQYFPYAPVPNVKHIVTKVPDLPAATWEANQNDILGPDMTQLYAQGAGMKTIDVCTHGEVLLGGTQKAIVKPTDFVIYNQQTLIPIGVIPERDFGDLYTDKFELCEKCLASAQGLKQAPPPSDKQLSMPEIVNLITSGIGWDVGNGIVIRSEKELIEYMSKNGIKL